MRGEAQYERESVSPEPACDGGDPSRFAARSTEIPRPDGDPISRAISVAAASAAIADQEYARETWTKIRAERGRLTSELQALGWSVLPSQANFVLATVPGGRAARVHAMLKARGVLVRYFNVPGLDDKLRITVGTPEDTDALLAALA